MPFHSAEASGTKYPELFRSRELRGAVWILLYLLLALPIGCGASRGDYERLKTENDRLRSDLDECRNGANRLAAVAERAYADGKLKDARETIELLRARHPESPRTTDLGALIPDIDRRLDDERRRAEIEAQEQVRLRELSDTGIWVLGHFVDKFGNATRDAYIRNKQLIHGRFSNVATNGSNLTVLFIISASDKIAIQLFEYGGDNPVKVSSPEGYSVAVKTGAGDEHEFTALNFSDRLVLYEDSATSLHKALMSGGRLQFLIRGNTTEYQFAIDQAGGYRNAFQLLSDSLQPPASAAKPAGKAPHSKNRGPA